MKDNTVGEESWMRDAACATADLTDVDFFPHAGFYSAGARKAVEICKTCPVQEDCLEFALRTNQVGIWGGMTERGRQRIRRKLLRELKTRGG